MDLLGAIPRGATVGFATPPPRPHFGSLQRHRYWKPMCCAMCFRLPHVRAMPVPTRRRPLCWTRTEMGTLRPSHECGYPMLTTTRRPTRPNHSPHFLCHTTWICLAWIWTADAIYSRECLSRWCTLEAKNASLLQRKCSPQEPVQSDVVEAFHQRKERPH